MRSLQWVAIDGEKIIKIDDVLIHLQREKVDDIVLEILRDSKIRHINH